MLPNTPQIDLNGNGVIDPEESAGDRNGDGGVDRDEWLGSSASSRGSTNRSASTCSSGPGRQPPAGSAGGGNGRLTAARNPLRPEWSRRLDPSGGAVPESEAPLSLGINTIGNARNTTLSTGSASCIVAADGDIDLNGRGSIETYQGSPLFVESVSGGIRGGVPPVSASGSAVHRSPRHRDAVPPGGTSSDVPARRPAGADISSTRTETSTSAGSRLQSLSGSDIDDLQPRRLDRRGGELEILGSDRVRERLRHREGELRGRRHLRGGRQHRPLRQAGHQDRRRHHRCRHHDRCGRQSRRRRRWRISGTNVNIDVGGSISGSISATGSINVAGGSVAQGASLSAGASSPAPAPASDRTAAATRPAPSWRISPAPLRKSARRLPDRAAAATGERQVMIQVTSRVIGDSEDEKKRP